MTIQAAPRFLTLSHGTLAFLLLVANLRPAVTSVGPLLEMVRSDLGLSGAMLGLLATLPLLIFAGFSPFGRLGQIFGIERTLAGCLALVVVGIALRSQGSTSALFGGTAILAIGIGECARAKCHQARLPAPGRKYDHSFRYGYEPDGRACNGLSHPALRSPGRWLEIVARRLDHLRRPGSGVLVAGNSKRERARGASTKPWNDAIWHSLLAWQVTLFMGAQFVIYYVTIGWMPLFLAAHGKSAAEAGWLLTLYQVMTFGVGFVAPGLLQRGRDQRGLAVVACAVTALSILGLLVTPRLAGCWLVICGASFGTTFILAFALIGMRAADHQRAASLSTMSQAIAYLIAAIGPVAFGWLHDLTAGWMVPMVGLLAIAIIQCLLGFGAGRVGYV